MICYLRQKTEEELEIENQVISETLLIRFLIEITSRTRIRW
jgi:hypothetical protein